MMAIASQTACTHKQTSLKRSRASEKWRYLRACLVVSLILTALYGCDKGTRLPQNLSVQPVQSAPELALPKAKVNQYTIALWQNQQQQLERALKHLPPLTAAIQILLDKPTPKHLKNAQFLWQPLALALEELSIFGIYAVNQHQSKMANWSLIAETYERIMSWPSELGFLDNNGTHGNTGLVFNVDVAITFDSLNAFHNLTHQQDSVFGLYPLSLMLQGAHAQRQASQLLAITFLSKEHKQQKLKNIDQHPQNRRRMLIMQQIQELADNLNTLHSQIKRRDNSSAFNAISQYSPAQQHIAHLKAAQALTGFQLQELSQYIDLPPWQHRWQHQRLWAQITGLEQWLKLLGNFSEAALCQDILSELKPLIPTKPLTPSAPTIEQPLVAEENLAGKENPAAREHMAAQEHLTQALTNQNSVTQKPLEQTPLSDDPLRTHLARLTVALNRAINIYAAKAAK